MPKMCSQTGLPGKGSAYKEDKLGNVYSYKQCIRTHDETLGYIFNATKYSVTTSNHQSISHKTANYPEKYHEVIFSSDFLVKPSDMILQARENIRMRNSGCLLNMRLSDLI